MIRLRNTTWVLLVVTHVACQGDDALLKDAAPADAHSEVQSGSDDGSIADAAVARVVAIERYIKARCDNAGNCIEQNGRKFSNRQRCEDHYRRYSSLSPPSFLGIPAYFWAFEYVDDCIDSIAAQGCAFDIAQTAACQNYANGTYYHEPLIEEGQSCAATGARCAEGLYCAQPLSNRRLCPVCKPYVQIGEACRGTSHSATCTAEAYCDSSVTQTCLPKGKEGEPCENSSPCLGGLQCDDETCTPAPDETLLSRDEPCGPDDKCRAWLVCRDGVCTDRQGEDEPCVPRPNRTSSDCLLDLACHGDTCKPLNMFERTEDGLCSAKTFCADEHYCRSEACTPYLAVGDDCDSGDVCVTGSACRDNKCTPYPAAGDDCSTWNQCVTGSWCTDGFCVVYAKIGESCEDNRCNPDLDAYCDSSNVCRDDDNYGDYCTTKSHCKSNYCSFLVGCADPTSCVLPD